MDVLLATVRKIRYQQNLLGRTIAVVVITGTTKWSHVRLHLERIAVVVKAATPGSYAEIDIPFSKTKRNPHVAETVLASRCKVHRIYEDESAHFAGIHCGTHAYPRRAERVSDQDVRGTRMHLLERLMQEQCDVLKRRGLLIVF